MYLAPSCSSDGINEQGSTNIRGSLLSSTAGEESGGSRSSMEILRVKKEGEWRRTDGNGSAANPVK